MSKESALSANAELVHHLLSGIPVVGTLPDITQLSDWELGTLAPLIWHPQAEHALLPELSALLQQRTPRFNTDTALAALAELAQHVEVNSSSGELNDLKPGQLQAITTVIIGCGDSEQKVFVPVLKRLAEGIPASGTDYVSGGLDYVSTALLSCAGERLPAQSDELVELQQQYLHTLEEFRHRFQLASICSEWSTAQDDSELCPRGVDPLAQLPGYLEHARELTTRAVERAEAIQSKHETYRPDKAFTVAEAQLVRFALRAGLDQQAEWAIVNTLKLLQAVSVAPIESAKTVPSQSATIAIAKAIAERPSPRLVSGMKAAVSAIRHAGLKKKLARLLKTAERRMFEDDNFLFEIEADTKLPKALATLTMRALEHLLCRPEPLNSECWQSLFLAKNHIANIAAGLIWRLDSKTSVLAMASGKTLTLLDSQGEPCSPRAETVSLWHPLHNLDESSAWRNLIVQRGIQQPFNQAFRECYGADTITQFLTPEVDVRTLLGLGLAQGWLLRYGYLVRRFGTLRVELDTGGTYPGACGTTRIGAIDFYRHGGHKRIDPAQESPQLVSECLRAVDLLVSVAAFSVKPGAGPAGATASERQSALLHMMGAAANRAKPYVDGRYVKTGDVKISITTGRVTRNNQEIHTDELSGKATPLPYPDAILQKIVWAINCYSND